jgi:hypothetical protein
MFPGLSPIYINPQSQQTNRPPVAKEPGWSLAQSPNVTIPNIPGFFSVPMEQAKEVKKEKENSKREEKISEKGKEHNEKHGLFHNKK